MRLHNKERHFLDMSMNHCYTAIIKLRLLKYLKQLSYQTGACTYRPFSFKEVP